MALKYIALLLLCQLIGEAFVVWTGLPVPGPVIGMALLFVGVALRGGIPEGLNGAVIGPAVLAAARVRDHRALGLALGVASHGIGTARAFQIGSLAGAFSALAMGLMALASAFVLPLVLEAAFAR